MSGVLGVPEKACGQRPGCAPAVPVSSSLVTTFPGQQISYAIT